ncbi:hypothetical protein GCM10010420_15210 [Streptomyces glaucosporus]|uniref:Uncharacterized protein n=1 Tax=Streptomyces glaucosporus TaxID=284044 RepID=A0ABN3I008_9ACTN
MAELPHPLLQAGLAGEGGDFGDRLVVAVAPAAGCVEASDEALVEERGAVVEGAGCGGEPREGLGGEDLGIMARRLTGATIPTWREPQAVAV